MKLLRIHFTLAISLMLVAACGKSNNPQVAQEAFDAVKEKISDESFTSLEELFLTMKPGFSEMHEFLRICDENLVSDDELTRSTAFWCAETVSIMASMGDVRVTLDRKTSSQLEEANKYEWRNGEEIQKLGADSQYLKSRMPSYEALRARSSTTETGANKSE